MIIVALDIGSRLGYAIGAVGTAVPRSGARVLKDSDQPRAVAAGNLIAWIDKEFRKARPTICVKEAPLTLEGFRRTNNSQAAVMLTYGLHNIVEGMCQRYGVRCEDVNMHTVRKHFIGRANAGTRTATKQAVVNRARMLKYMPRDCANEDQADAIAVWDYAAHTFGRASGGQLALYGEVA